MGKPKKKSKPELRRGSGTNSLLRVPTMVIREGKLHAHWWILSPNSTWKEVWGILADVMILWSVVTTFYYLALSGPNLTGEILDTVVWAFFVLDFLFTCCTLIFDNKGRPVYSLRYIMLAYAQKDMLWDLIAILPLKYAGYAQVEYYLRIVRVRKVPDTLNFVDGTGIGTLIPPLVNMGKAEDTKEVGLTYKLIGFSFQLISGIILGTYILGCFWVWYATKVEHIPAEAMGSFDEMPDVADRRDWEKLERAWYFMMTTLGTIGYGDYLALNPYERICMICLQFIGIAAFSMTIGKINTMITEYNSLVSPPDTVGEMAVWLDNLEDRYSKIPYSLRLRIMSHFSHYQLADRLKSLALNWWTAESLEDLTEPKDKYLVELDTMTVKSVFNYLFEDLFSKYKLFFNLNLEFRYAVALHLQPRFYLADEEIIGEDDTNEEIFFLLSGEVTCGVYESSKTYVPILTYKRRAIFGEYSALTGTASSVVYKVSRSAPAELMALPIKPLQSLLDEKYLDVKVKLLKQAMDKMAFIRRNISSHYSQTQNQEIFNLVRRFALSPQALIPETPLRKLKSHSKSVKTSIVQIQKLIAAAKTWRAKFRAQRLRLLRVFIRVLDARLMKQYCKET